MTKRHGIQNLPCADRRLWGYNVGNVRERARVEQDPDRGEPNPVNDQSEAANDNSPFQAERFVGPAGGRQRSQSGLGAPGLASAARRKSIIKCSTPWVNNLEVNQ